jgi:hypothetical protein
MLPYKCTVASGQKKKSKKSLRSVFYSRAAPSVVVLSTWIIIEGKFDLKTKHLENNLTREAE